jgi:hypothetical protein
MLRLGLFMDAHPLIPRLAGGVMAAERCRG